MGACIREVLGRFSATLGFGRASVKKWSESVRNDLLQPTREMLLSCAATLALSVSFCPGARGGPAARTTSSEEEQKAGDFDLNVPSGGSESNSSVLLRMTIRLSVRITASVVRKGETFQVPRVA